MNFQWPCGADPGEAGRRVFLNVPAEMTELGGKDVHPETPGDRRDPKGSWVEDKGLEASGFSPDCTLESPRALTETWPCRCQFSSLGGAVGRGCMGSNVRCTARRLLARMGVQGMRKVTMHS